MEKNTSVVSTNNVDVTVSAKAMLMKVTPKVRMYRIDAIKDINLVITQYEDKFEEKIAVTLNTGYNIDGVEAKDSIVTMNSISALIKVLPNIRAPKEVVAKYAKPKKCKVTVDELLNNEKISESLKGMLVKEIDNL